MEVIDGSMQRVTGPLSHYLDTVTLEVPIRSKEDIIAYPTMRKSTRMAC